jgi:hypothetical protein
MAGSQTDSRSGIQGELDASEKLRLDRDKLSFERQKYDEEATKRRLEAEKLEQEIRDLKRPWYGKPSYLQPLATLLVAIVGGVIAFGTDVFKSNLLTLQREREKLQAENEVLQGQAQSLSARINADLALLKQQTNRYNVLLEQQSVEVTKLQERGKLATLGDVAISESPRSSIALRELRRLQRASGEETTRSSAQAELARVSAFWGTASYLDADYRIALNGKQGNDEALSPCVLVQVLRSSHNWKDRARSADILRFKPYKGVPEALIEVMEDEFVDVARHAKRAFDDLSGEYGSYLPEVDKVKSWWGKNGPTITTKWPTMEPCQANR